jgi:hypothetical protein
VNINELRTNHLAPHETLLALSVDLADGLTSPVAKEAVGRIYGRSKSAIPKRSRILIEVQDKRG